MMERKKYPIGSEFYELYEEIGQGVSAAVYRAICLPTSEIVAIKIIDFEKHNSDLSKISREAQTMILVDHPNVLRAYCSFVSDHTLWVVMPYMDGGSCLHVLKAAYPDGFGEVVIATILREVLKGLEYLHQHGHIHRDVKAGNILVDVRGSIKLGDFGVSACLFDSGDRQRVRNTFVGTPCWMAPEVMEQLNGYDFKADIWSFGITAMELAHGHAPFSKYPPMKVLLMTLQNAPPGLDYERDKKFSKSFKQMIAMCLVKDPSKRPTARKLSKHSFFKQARSNDYFARTILEGLPALGDRIRDLKRKDEDMLAQKKMPDGEKEEISQNEYKRGLSGWNFNIEDMKAQASLIQDAEEDIPDKDEGGSSSSLSGLDVQEKKIQCQSSINTHEDGDLMQNRPDTPPSLDLSANCLRGRWDRSEDDFSVAGSTSSCEHYNGHDDSQRHVGHIETDCNGKHEQDTTGRHLEGMNIRSPRTRESSSVTNLPGLSLPTIEESDSQTNVQNMPSCNGAVVPQAVDDAGTETVGRTSKLSASNSEDLEEKLKGPVVQQRGRFKVTSEKAELEKASPSPMLQKSHSLQVISQPPIVSAPSDGTSSNLFSALHYLLQTNIAQRDSLLYLMKQLGPGDATSATNGYPTAGNIPSAMTEKSMLEAANEREKELVQELNDLQWRLITTQEELQRFKIKNAQV